MAIKTKKLNDKLATAADQAKENPYLSKIIEDKELRDNAVAALQSVKTAFDQAKVKGFDNPAELVQDKKIKKNLKDAATTLKSTSDEIASAGKKKKRHPLRKVIALAVIGGIVAVVVSEDARKAVLDTLFGAEEEFEYTSTTSAPAGSSTNGAS
jgi:hypothetical protein